jgi:Protein of unknown function (DUF3617)
MKVALLVPVAVSLALALPGALAQKVAPGLWETQTEMKVGNADMQAQMKRAQEQMASMPPEQRKMMQDMMAKQGVQMGAGAGGRPAFRYCVSKEQAERAEVPQDADGRCKRDSMVKSGSTMRFKFTCTNPPSTGTGEITFTSDKAYAMKMVVDGTSAKGQPGTMEMNSNAKWVSADCGTLKPRP